MQICEDFDGVRVLKLDGEHEWAVATAVDFVLIYEEDAVLLARDQPRDQRQVTVENGLMQNVLLFL